VLNCCRRRGHRKPSKVRNDRGGIEAFYEGWFSRNRTGNVTEALRVRNVRRFEG
jgi:hypothetical protein